MSEANIKLKRSSVPGKVPTTEQIDLGEVAINTHDGKMFFKRDENGNLTIREVGLADKATNVLYVSEDGVIGNSGQTIAEAFSTLDSACAVADSDTTIFVKSGDHTVNNPLIVPRKVAIVGDNLRTTTIRGASTDSDILWLNAGTYVTGVTFRGHQNGAAAVAFPGDSSGGSIFTSPYVQNCSSITTDGTGMKIDGKLVGGLKSMVADAFTQINTGGVGVHLLNRGYAQLVSIFTVSTDVGVLTETGGNCSLTNSNCSFGNYGLKSTGVSETLYSGTSGAAAAGQNTLVVNGLSERPKYGDAVKIGSEDFYYTVIGATALSSGTSTITIEETFNVDVASSSAVTFHQRSLITASSITFEYVGSGTNIYDTPRSGAFPIQANEVVFDSSNNAGLVYFTSTDHKGDFRIGGELTINRQEGTITGTTFDRSLFAVLTPYILALED